MQKVKETIARIKTIDYKLAEQTQKKLDNLTKPQGSLGRLEELAKRIVAITGQENPTLENKVIFTMAADHGVVQEGVSAFPQEVTLQMVQNFLTDGAGINVLARQVGAKVIVVDMGIANKIQNTKYKMQNFKDKKIALGTQNMAKGPAMAKQEAIAALEAGIEVFEEEFANGIDIIGTGDMGIGNTTASSAIAACFTKASVKDLTGRGTGIDDESLKNKIAVINKTLKINRPDANNAIDVLAKVGGFEIGGLAGLILAAASRRVPVVIDGFISGASALIACHLQPEVREYLIAAHCSVERGHAIILEHLGLVPLLDLELRLGEGTGSALAMHLTQAAVNILTQMATFENAAISKNTQ